MFSPFVPLFLLSVFNVCFANPEYNKDVQLQCNCGSTSNLAGNLVPVVPPINKYGSPEYSMIPKYCSMLTEARISGIILYSSETLSYLDSLSDKKKGIKAWVDNCPQLTIIVQVRCATTNETLQLAEFCRKVRGVEGIICEIDKFQFRKNTTVQVVENMKPIAETCYPKPFLLSDLTLSCEFNYNDDKLVKVAKEQIKNFCGILVYYTPAIKIFASIKLDSSISIISASSVEINGAYANCLNGTSTLIANIFPIWAARIPQLIFKGQYVEAADLQAKISRIFFTCLNNIINSDFLDRSQKGFGLQIMRYLMMIVKGLKVGFLPYPAPQLTRDQKNMIYKICQDEGVANYPAYDDDKTYPENYKNKNKYDNKYD